MKIRIAFLSLLALSTYQVASAQVEHDDMYFNSKDRSKMVAAKPAMITKSISAEHEVATSINPTDSYSARNVNPEYISQSKMGSATSEQAPYFIPDYTPTSVNQKLSNSSYSNYYNYNNLAMGGYYPYSNMYGYGSPYSMYGFGSPYNYYSSMYGYNPYGWSNSLSFGYGMGGYYPYSSYYYPYGGSSWAMGVGMGWSSFYGYNPYYNMGYYGYPYNRVIVVNDYNSRNVVYGKRTSRSSDINNNVTYSNRTRSTTQIADSQGRVTSTGGRVSSDGTSSSYYQRGWRSNPATNSGSRTDWSSSGRTSGTSTANRNHSDYGFGSRSNSSFSSGSPSRSSSYGGGSSGFSSGGGSRSGGGSSGSSSGVTRGRN